MIIHFNQLSDEQMNLTVQQLMDSISIQKSESINLSINEFWSKIQNKAFAFKDGDSILYVYGNFIPLNTDSSKICVTKYIISLPNKKDENYYPLDSSFMQDSYTILIKNLWKEFQYKNATEVNPITFNQLSNLFANEILPLSNIINQMKKEYQDYLHPDIKGLYTHPFSYAFNTDKVDISLTINQVKQQLYQKHLDEVNYCRNYQNTWLINCEYNELVRISNISDDGFADTEEFRTTEDGGIIYLKNKNTNFFIEKAYQLTDDDNNTVNFVLNQFLSSHEKTKPAFNLNPQLPI